MRYFLYGTVALEAFLIALFIVPIIRKLAISWNVVDKPGERKIHYTPKALMGGVGIFTAFYVTVLVNVIGFYLLYHTSFVQSHLQTIVRVAPMLDQVVPKLVVILGGGAVIHMLGILDDILKEKLTYKPKFIVQIVVALVVSLMGVRTHFMPGTALDVFVTTIWIVGVTNSFNLLDNMDGLTAGVSVIAALFLFVIAVLQGQIFFAFMLAALIGACLGFLPYNFNPAKLFMGDSGSLFLGYIFATLTVTGSYVVPTSQTHIPIMIPILILSIPLYDTFSVMFIRWREKRPLFLGDKRHFSHRLHALGMSQRQAVTFIYLVGLCVGGVATLLPYISLIGNVVVLVQIIIIYIIITFLIVIGKQNQNS